MKTIIIDGNEIISMSEIHTIFAEELDFPDWYGKNLDALYDCLGDVAEEVEIIFENTSELEENLGISFQKLCHLLEDISEENEYISVEI